MTVGQFIGCLLVAAPFVAIAVVGVREIGWGETLAVFGGIAAVCLVIASGVYLVSGGA